MDLYLEASIFVSVELLQEKIAPTATVPTSKRKFIIVKFTLNKDRYCREQDDLMPFCA
jgi:hypothetical protein